MQYIYSPFIDHLKNCPENFSHFTPCICNGCEYEKVTPQLYNRPPASTKSYLFVGVAGSGRAWQFRGGVFEPREWQAPARRPWWWSVATLHTWTHVQTRYRCCFQKLMFVWAATCIINTYSTSGWTACRGSASASSGATTTRRINMFSSSHFRKVRKPIRKYVLE